MLSEFVAKMRYQYHLNAIELVNVANQLGLIKNDKAEKKNKSHVMKVFNDILPRIYGEDMVRKLFGDFKD